MLVTKIERRRKERCRSSKKNRNEKKMKTGVKP
jgi:hypothetical protein